MQIAICDSNDAFLEKIKNNIGLILGDVADISTHNNAFSLITYVLDDSHGKVDLVFVSLKLGRQSGLTVAETLMQELSEIKIVFIVDERESIKDIFEVNPFYVLFKPLEEQYLKRALFKAIRDIDEQDVDLVRVMVNRRRVSMKVQNIYYIESNCRQLEFHLYDNAYRTYGKINDYEQLPNFIRCHQSFLVNVDKISEINSNGEIVMTNGTVLPISRARAAEVLEAINAKNGNYNKSISSKDDDIYCQPVLKCVFGALKGHEYVLSDGSNYVGTSYEMKICVQEDSLVTKDNHCNILWQKSNSRIKLIPSYGALTYVNNKLAKNTVEIDKSDAIRIGMSEYRIVFPVKNDKKSVKNDKKP